MAGKITDYPTMTTLASGDLLDVSDYDGVSAFVSKSIDWDILKTNIEGQITFTNLYTADGTLAGNRIVSMGVNDLTFGSTGDASLLRFDSTSDRIGIGTAAPIAKAHIVQGVVDAKATIIEGELNSSLPLVEYINNDATFGVGQETQFNYKQGASTTARMSHVSNSSSDWGFKFYTYKNFLNSTPTLTLKGDNLNGINVAAPLANWHVNGVTGNNPFRVDDGGTGIALMVLGGGDVGIGTTTPSQKLDVAGAVKVLNGIGTNGTSPSASVAVRTALNTTAISFGPTGGACFGQASDNTEISTVISSKDIRFKQGANHVATINRATTGMLQSAFTIRGQGATAVLTDRFSEVNFLSNYWDGALSQDKTASWKHNTINTSGDSEFNLDIGGTVTARFDEDSTATNTRFMIYDVDNATLERVSVGVADSGGVGFKLLRIPN